MTDQDWMKLGLAANNACAGTLCLDAELCGVINALCLSENERTPIEMMVSRCEDLIAAEAIEIEQGCRSEDWEYAAREKRVIAFSKESLGAAKAILIERAKRGLYPFERNDRND